MATKFQMIGTTDELDQCGCCGRMGLKGVVVLKDQDGNFHYFGSVCAAKALGWGDNAAAGRKVESAAKQADKETRQAMQAAIATHPLSKVISDEIKAANAVTPRMSFADRRPLMHRWNDLQAQVRGEIEAQFGRKLYA